MRIFDISRGLEGTVRRSRGLWARDSTRKGLAHNQRCEGRKCCFRIRGRPSDLQQSIDEPDERWIYTRIPDRFGRLASGQLTRSTSRTRVAAQGAWVSSANDDGLIRIKRPMRPTLGLRMEALDPGWFVTGNARHLRPGLGHGPYGGKRIA